MEMELNDGSVEWVGVNGKVLYVYERSSLSCCCCHGSETSAASDRTVGLGFRVFFGEIGELVLGLNEGR